jgi:methylated-DNA-[protein]-cysteine S-methyltransferase
MMTQCCEFDTPLGPMRAMAEDGAIIQLDFLNTRHPTPPDPGWRRQDDAPLWRRLRSQLMEYFAGTRRQFHLPLELRGTAFQRSVWRGLERIPFGATISYGALAAAVGHPGSGRAVGAALGRNPVAIVVPCHRVIGADGSLTGYASGLARKRWLLEWEAAQANDRPGQVAISLAQPDSICQPASIARGRSVS